MNRFTFSPSFLFGLFIVLLGFLSPRANAAPIPQAGSPLLKRCYYVGTFFQLIDCNAAADSTKIPFAPEVAASTSSAGV